MAASYVYVTDNMYNVCTTCMYLVIIHSGIFIEVVITLKIREYKLDFGCSVFSYLHWILTSKDKRHFCATFDGSLQKLNHTNNE